MTKGTKIALGCLGAGCLVVAGVAAVLVFGMGAGAYWLKGKAQTFLGEEQKIEALKQKANQVPFTQPADGVVAEDRLVKFLAVRKRVFSVYEKHRPEFEAMKNKKDADLTDIKAAFDIWSSAVCTASSGMSFTPGTPSFRAASTPFFMASWACFIISAMPSEGGLPELFSISAAQADWYTAWTMN